MNFKHLLLAILATGALSAAAEEPADGLAANGLAADTADTKTTHTCFIAKTKEKLKNIEDKLKFGGYIIGKYSYSDR